eukprot:1193661-Prorocentrum_minimum.AAC.1
MCGSGPVHRGHCSDFEFSTPCGSTHVAVRCAYASPTNPAPVACALPIPCALSLQFGQPAPPPPGQAQPYGQQLVPRGPP